MRMDNVIYLFKDMSLQKWAFRWNDQHFWTSMSHKTPVDQVQLVVARMNPKYQVVVPVP